MTTSVLAEAQRPTRVQLSRDDYLMRGFLGLVGVWMLVTVVLPLYVMLSKSTENDAGAFVGLRNFIYYFSNPALFDSLYNSLWIASLSTVMTISLAFIFAYALTRSQMWGKSVLRLIAALPLLAPSLLSAIALIYLFGNQGFLKDLLLGNSIYGPIGIVMGEVFFCFPHALMILITALSLADARLYEAADALRASGLKTFFTVTLPNVKYGLISATFVVFNLVITDFGIPKVIGGQFDVLATDVYKQVIGQQNFAMGAVISVLLLVPAVVAFVIERFAQRKQVALLTARSVPYQPKPNQWLDTGLFVYCGIVSIIILTVIGTAAFASLVKFWPYDLSLTLNNYNFELFDGGGWDAFYNSLEMATYTALFGTVIIFCGAYVIEKLQGLKQMRGAIQFLCLLPMAIPSMVLGLAYIFFFNHPNNPLNFIYGSMAILVIVTIIHYYTVGHLTAITALKQIDNSFEAVSASLKVPSYITFWRVTVPVCLPAILEISIYLFIQAMTTASAVIFLYSPDTTLASVAALNMDDAGDIAPAAAMCMLIVLAAATVKLAHTLISFGLMRWLQGWRHCH